MRRCIAARALTLIALVCFPAPTYAGPLEAERLYAAARAQKNAPWPRALRAWRAVLREAGAADPIRARTWRAIAACHEKAGQPHAALAARRRAVQLMRRDESYASYLLAYARGLFKEGDLEAGRATLEEVARVGALRAPRPVASAWRLLARDAFERGDQVALRSWALEMDGAPNLWVERMEAWGWLGLLHHGQDSAIDAERCLKRVEGIYEGSLEGRDEALIRKATRLWLDLPLRRALGR